ncbi:hypothetical protein AB0N89_34010 [Amycolatopsis sp. NPDC089917]|uniref:hypothetical protein n=1 Tax=Amycolatopsis sp. NPDC089917 TaxID=3155187 RepID=UPI00343CCF88
MAVTAAALTATVPATATASTGTGPEIQRGCASLAANGPGKAKIKNICTHRINATVEVDGFNPDCISINAGKTGTIRPDPQP